MGRGGREGERDIIHSEMNALQRNLSNSSTPVLDLKCPE